MLQRLKRKEEGFTIIEVLIVLAIAGLIMLIVFFAVPSLQRSQRNSARNSDGALISAAVNECLANHNGNTGSCSALSSVSVSIDTGKLGQLTTAPSNQTTAANAKSNANKAASTWIFGQKCTPAGDDITPGSTRDYAVLFKLEDQGGNDGALRCLGT